ncbi:methyl-accepting chemotaxis protein [Methylophilaceae bacterium 11]|jgi:twitching motility protein PilJ|uniref:methyl-accepting chemotaxis protein n=1 Tax=unclassified Methylotenera TaxID=2643294 RepID=UPI00036763D6|nr:MULTISPECIES: methyl-accepting chemotaxis protein [unclassified Methylotenera]EUJ10081.1 methyl-accepting chemotaxis protein [Methylophilaceae bacterium 11]
MAINVGFIKAIPEKVKQLFAKREAVSGGKTSYAQVYWPVIGFVVFTALAAYTIHQVRVNGPEFNKIQKNNDLRADISPPSLYAVDAFAAANEAYVATTNGDYQKRDKKLEEVKRYEVVFKERLAYWKANAEAGNMTGAFEAVAKSNENFYRIFNKDFDAAIKLGAIAAAKPLADLASAYEVNKQTANTLKYEVEKLSSKTSEEVSSLLVSILAALVLLGLAIVFAMIYFGIRQVKAIDTSVKRLEDDGQSNQMAVLNLLDEMGDLADGDLTVRAQVRENITGAIADSINYTIDNLRDLVTEITRASEQVNTATAQAQQTSVSLLSATEQQYKQITDTTDAVTTMTRSILQVSSNASQASEVAQRSLQAASQGSKAVQNTIQGMNSIREQIQETSKRIKRLGESSQEISEIVDLISDITEQTNILALNAAIQAASAGEAGRGFTVVAEEVQRLAERSSEATKQIGAIVKTIQTDTNSAVAAMEKSTEGVVEGAQLSDAAGRALAEIENVTNNLARLIESISSATEAQTQVASTVTKNMQQIQEITTQTTEGTKVTATSVGQLTSLAKELRESVAGFKLA